MIKMRLMPSPKLLGINMVHLPYPECGFQIQIYSGQCGHRLKTTYNLGTKMDRHHCQAASMHRLLLKAMSYTRSLSPVRFVRQRHGFQQSIPIYGLKPPLGPLHWLSSHFRPDP